jgi:hypothetical protein
MPSRQYFQNIYDFLEFMILRATNFSSSQYQSLALAMMQKIYVIQSERKVFVHLQNV